MAPPSLDHVGSGTLSSATAFWHDYTVVVGLTDAVPIFANYCMCSPAAMAVLVSKSQTQQQAQWLSYVVAAVVEWLCAMDVEALAAGSPVRRPSTGTPGAGASAGAGAGAAARAGAASPPPAASDAEANDLMSSPAPTRRLRTAVDVVLGVDRADPAQMRRHPADAAKAYLGKLTEHLNESASLQCINFVDHLYVCTCKCSLSPPPH